MEQTIRRIALFAYVIGGWLMPAAHHHVHASTSGSATCGSHSAFHSHPCDPAGSCEKHQHDDNAGDCCGDAGACSTLPPGELSGHQVTACHQVDDSSPPAAPTASEITLNGTHPSGDDCGGLCALCSARSLSACRGSAVQLCSRTRLPRDVTRTESQLLPPGAVLRPRFCRGPPCCA